MTLAVYSPKISDHCTKQLLASFLYVNKIECFPFLKYNVHLVLLYFQYSEDMVNIVRIPIQDTLDTNSDGKV